MPDTEKRRAIVYIDALNLYYGALKHTSHKWLDLQALFTRLRPHDELVQINYFTALVKFGPKRTRQLAYLAALGTRPLVTVHMSNFKLKTIECRYETCPIKAPRLRKERLFFKMPEEKRTDVRIAIAMVDDAYNNRADNFVLVTGDSDLAPAVAHLKRFFPRKRVFVYIPAPHAAHIRAAAVELRGLADKARELPQLLIQVSQLPRELLGASGQAIVKPAEWK